MPDRRPHLVQLTFQLPHRRGGGSARQFFLLRELAQDFDVTVVAPEDPGTPADALEQLSAFATPIVFPVPVWSRNPLRRAVRLAQMTGSPRPVASTGMDPLRGPMRSILAALPRPADVVYVEPSTVADWIGLAPAHAIAVLGFHDLTFAAYRERARQQTGLLARAFDEVEWRKLRRLELGYAAAAELAVMISTPEQRRLRELVPDARTALVPDGVDREYFRRTDGGGPDPAGPLVMLGSLNHPPNVDAAIRMARDVLPELLAGGRDVRLQLVGRSPVQDVLALDTHPGVEVVGEVADVRPYLAAASIVCAPIMFGGGVRMKLLDALAMECAVVGTPKAAEGFDVADDAQLVITPIERFADAVGALLDDPGRAARLARDGRRFVEREHAWAASGRVLSDAIADRLRERAAHAGA